MTEEDTVNLTLKQISPNREIAEGVYLELLYNKAQFEGIIGVRKVLDLLVRSHNYKKGWTRQSIRNLRKFRSTYSGSKEIQETLDYLIQVERGFGESEGHKVF